jgi:transposase-like protein
MNLSQQRVSERIQLEKDGLYCQYGVPVDCPTCGEMKWRRHGKTRNGNARLRCQCCGRTILNPLTYLAQTVFGGMRNSTELQIAILMLLKGNSIRESARMAGMSKDTVAKLFPRLLAELSRSGRGDIYCPCGRKSPHRGWCSYRFENSPARKAVMAKMHSKFV